MKRSAINHIYRKAHECFVRHGWALPPNPRWDITDFGLGDFEHFGLTLINLSEQKEYCEKLMYARRGQTTPCHTHARKKEDIICRAGELTLLLWPDKPVGGSIGRTEFIVPVNGEPLSLKPGDSLVLAAGSRVTLVPGVWHEFFPSSDECIIGEVSTANDDLNDNFFLNPDVGRFPGIDEDEKKLITLISE